MIEYKNNSAHYNKMKRAEYLSFYDCGMISSAPEWNFGTRFLEHFELIAVKNGIAPLSIDGMRMTLTANTAVLLPPYVTISGSGKCAPDTHIYTAAFFADSSELTERTCALLNIMEPDFFWKCFSELAAIQLGVNRDVLSLDALLALLLRMSSSAKITRVRSTAVQRAANYIASNLNKPLTSSSVAQVLSYNKDYLCREIKRQTGFTMKQYINDIKLKTAKTLLTTTTLPVMSIAAQLGYSEENLFTKFFTYHETITPTMYRQRNQISGK
ncbi:MAG: helix-turn-helix transcriptional regulator [Ruminococcaceae bacterium]|nr:helix-turn-helix transcriptional regulator [Oscillospiraceae bacterium]